MVNFGEFSDIVRPLTLFTKEYYRVASRRSPPRRKPQSSWASLRDLEFSVYHSSLIVAKSALTPVASIKAMRPIDIRYEHRASSPRLVISAKLSDTGSRPILLQLDSGSSGQMLFADDRDLKRPILRHARLQGPELGEARRAYALLPPQDVRIGKRLIRNVPFVTPVHAELKVPDREEDGILSTVLFRRVYISHTDRYVIFEPR